MQLTRRSFLRTVPWVIGGSAVPFAAAQATSVRGIDVSHWQGTINWASAQASGLSFAMCKATEGTTYTDPTFETNWRGMKAAGLIRGAYHFGRPQSDAVAQARFFVNTVQPQKGDLQLVLDLEQTDGKTPAQVWAWTQAFCAEVQRLTLRPGIIYTGFYFWRDNVGNPTNNLNCPLWLAAYVTNPANYVAAAWSTWSFWQYTSSGTTPGISGNVDQNYFNGTTTQLRSLTLARSVRTLR
ncbi:MAG: glycoside hydrolase family 25 protein [Gemmataceae bacterium]